MFPKEIEDALAVLSDRARRGITTEDRIEILTGLILRIMREGPISESSDTDAELESAVRIVSGYVFGPRTKYEGTSRIGELFIWSTREARSM